MDSKWKSTFCQKCSLERVGIGPNGPGTGSAGVFIFLVRDFPFGTYRKKPSAESRGVHLINYYSWRAPKSWPSSLPEGTPEITENLIKPCVFHHFGSKWDPHRASPMKPKGIEIGPNGPGTGSAGVFKNLVRDFVWYVPKKYLKYPMIHNIHQTAPI